MRRYTFLFIVFLISIGINISCVPANNTDQDMQVDSKASTKEVQLNDGLYARVITSKGTITVVLEFEKTPLTVVNFV